MDLAQLGLVSSYYYMCPHTTICVSSSYYICVLILLYSYYYICVLIQLHMCPHTRIGVSSYYSCVLILLYMCPLVLYVC